MLYPLLLKKFMEGQSHVTEYNKFFYITNNNQVINVATSAFAPATLVSNTYTGGQGTMVFDRALTIIADGDDLTEVGAFAYGGNIGNQDLTTVYNSNITTIGTWAFAYCSNISIASFPNCTEIKKRAFCGCVALSSASFPECLTVDEKAFQNCWGYYSEGGGWDCRFSLSLPKCQSIGYRGFYGTPLSTINLPCCEYIGEEAFANYGDFRYLTNVSLSACNYIGSGAFTFNEALQTITIGASSVCTLGENAFTSTPIASGTGSIYVSASLVTAYQSATNWAQYSSQIFAIPE